VRKISRADVALCFVLCYIENMTYTANLTQVDILEILALHFKVEPKDITLAHHAGCDSQRDYVPPSITAEVKLPLRTMVVK
jgi:hypothetical protein